jgi:predicted nucleotidyltransferase
MDEATIVDTTRQPFGTRDSGFSSPEHLRLAVARIIELAKPVRVIAFGSRARGTHLPESDLDLAVILERFDPRTDQPPVKRTDLDLPMALDILLASRERHEYMRDSIISVHHDIEQEGVVLYDSATGSIDYRAVERIAR